MGKNFSRSHEVEFDSKKAFSQINGNAMETLFLFRLYSSHDVHKESHDTAQYVE